MEDAIKLKRLTHRLYEHIYSHYEEMEEINMLSDQSLMFDIDYMEERHEKELLEINSLLAQKDAKIAELEAKLSTLQLNK